MEAKQVTEGPGTVGPGRDGTRLAHDVGLEPAVRMVTPRVTHADGEKREDHKERMNVGDKEARARGREGGRIRAGEQLHAAKLLNGNVIPLERDREVQPREGNLGSAVQAPDIHLVLAAQARVVGADGVHDGVQHA